MIDENELGDFLSQCDSCHAVENNILIWESSWWQENDTLLGYVDTCQNCMDGNNSVISDVVVYTPKQPKFVLQKWSNDYAEWDDISGYVTQSEGEYAANVQQFGNPGARFRLVRRA